LAKSRPSRTSGELKSDFLHVIDSHRWLAVSGCIWNLVKPKAPGAFKESVEKLVPNIGVMARDSVLLHARSLIKFYKNVEGRDGTDILLKDFGVSISSPIERRLERRDKQIEVHLLHLTHYRDPKYRAAIANPRVQRPDWNKQTSKVAELILTALKNCSKCPPRWAQAFARLHWACCELYRNKFFEWPKELGNRKDVYAYLRRLGL
jgi:hypothetical protein